MINLIDAKNWDKDKIFILDTETTGLNENDEVLSLSIIDFKGNILFDHLIRPSHRKTWVKAQEIHGISPKDVNNEQLLIDYEEELKPIFCEGNLIVGYNVTFDLEMLEQSGARFQCEFFDVMKPYSAVYGAWSDWKQERKYSKLSACAKHYNYGSFQAHGSLEDTKATAHCFKCMLADEKLYEYWRSKLGYKPNETTKQRDERRQKEHD